jgi:hypothetical protein
MMGYQSKVQRPSFYGDVIDALSELNKNEAVLAITSSKLRSVLSSEKKYLMNNITGDLVTHSFAMSPMAQSYRRGG